MPVDRSGNEAERIGAKFVKGVIGGSEPVPEMLRLIRKSAHVGGADVENVSAALGAERKATTELASFFDQNDIERPGLVRLQQMAGREDAAHAAADDRNTSS